MELLLKPDMCGILIIFIIIWVNNVGILAVDNFGLLFGSLRTFQAHACDGHELTLNCTSNTVISINFVRYGRAAGRGDLCPGPGSRDSPLCEVKSALQVIEEKCRGQVLCRLLLSPDMFFEDPCPGVRKYAEVAYKCKPETFLNKIVCEEDHLYLSCPAGHSIAIYSAFYGTTQSEVPECTQLDGIHTSDCSLSYATENIARLCNGRPRCALLAALSTFEDIRRTVPFTCTGRKHLKVTYNCVPSSLLNKLRMTEKASEESIQTTSFPGWVRAYDQPLLNNFEKKHESVVIRSSTSPSNAFRSEMQSDEIPSEDTQSSHLSGDQKLVSFMSQVMSAQKYVAGNKDKLILYVALTVGMGFMFFVTMVFARFLVTRVRIRRNSKPGPTPVVDDDQFFSDSDLEQFDPDEILPAPATLNYTSSLRRQSSDVQPRTPIAGDGTELNHYFS